ncbi:MAG: LysE family translocator [Ignavibacteria bacterium]
MFESTTLFSYFAASAAIVVSPGPAQALVLAVTINDGRKAGIVTVIGLNSSVIIHILAAAAGVSAILATSAEAFTIIKYLGAFYLIYIGIKTLLSKKESGGETNLKFKKGSKLAESFSKGFLTGALNPKVALFFLAFVPQFVDPGRGDVIIQFILLGIILAGMDIIYESILAVLIGKLRNHFLTNNLCGALREKISGLVMIGLGIRMVFLKQV